MKRIGHPDGIGSSGLGESAADWLGNRKGVGGGYHLAVFYQRCKGGGVTTFLDFLNVKGGGYHLGGFAPTPFFR